MRPTAVVTRPPDSARPRRAQLPASVIVVTHNHAAHIGACLRSLLELDPAPREILVVDNASDDGTLALLRREFPDLPLIASASNLGFAGANNLAAAQASGEFLVLANPDLIVRPDWLRQLLLPLQSIPQAGVSGAKLLFPDGLTIQHAGGELVMPLALSQHRGHGQPDAGQYEVLAPVEYVTGAALACRRELWQQLGGLDEGFYPAYYEEVDFCARARAAGWSVLYAPQAVALHSEAAGLGRHSAAFYRSFHRNRLRLLFKHRGIDWLLRVWLPVELRYLRSVVEEAEIEALAAVYLAYQLAACAGEQEAQVSLAAEADTTALGGETELRWVTRQLHEKARLEHVPPTARQPWLGGLRRLLSRLLVADDLRPVLQQQSNANAAMAQAVAALVRQRGAADAAVVLQGMLLARLWREHETRR